MEEKKCIVCNETVSLEEYQSLAQEFKSYSVHVDCFDTFVNADEFLKFASHQQASNRSASRSLSRPSDVSPG